MEARPYARLSVAAIGLRFTPESNAHTSCLTPTLPSSYTCKIKLSHFESQTVSLPIWSPAAKTDPDPSQVAASFYLDEPALTKLLSGSRFSRKPHLKAVVYLTTQDECVHCASCWAAPRVTRMQRERKCIGKFKLPVGVELASPKAGLQLYNGWVSMGQYGSSKVEFHMNVRVDLDPRYIFQFDGEPELNPQIVHVQGNIRQPIFSCKFTRDRSSQSRAGALDGGHGGASEWVAGGKSAQDRNKKGRKGWLLLIYDLSGSPVAAASMVTPFVPSSGCNRVSRANPGAWLIMKAGPVGEDCWRPWGRLEAWREKGTKGGLGCRFQLMAEGGDVVGFNNHSVLVSETVISSQKGGDFFIDTAKFKPETPVSASPVDSPQSSGDFYFNLGVPAADCGFVMSANVQGEGKTTKPPHVQLAMRHVACVEDAAVYMALAAAVDLSMDACLPFSKKLGKSFLSHA
eukprot:c24617_g1_i1 orf=279-1652(-)